MMTRGLVRMAAEAAFNHAKLAADKNVTNDHLGRIVRSYDAGLALGRTRDAHLKQIRQAFVRRARFENKIR